VEEKLLAKKYGKGFLADKEGGFAVQQFFRRLRQRRTEAPEASRMFSVGCGLEFSHLQDDRGKTIKRL
jgi:hypothetical protein